MTGGDLVFHFTGAVISSHSFLVVRHFWVLQIQRPLLREFVYLLAPVRVK